MTRPARVLIADDQRDVLEALRLLLKGEGLECETASSPPGVLAALEARDYDAVLIDLNYTRDTTSGQEGLDLLARIRDVDPDLPILVMTAWGTVDLAVEAMRARRARFRAEAVGERAAARDALAPRSRCGARSSRASGWRPRTASSGRRPTPR